MSPPLNAASVAAALLALALLPGPAPFAVAAADAASQAYTLYGDTGLGWGLANTTVTDPGPNLTVYVGQPVALTLIGLDRVKHNWFIDYNGNKVPDGAEPSSPDFIRPTPLEFTFTPDREGNWTYYCRYHQTVMYGTIHVIPQTNVTLYGDGAFGWGLTNTTVTSPGPRLVLVLGTNVTFTLYSNDSDRHNFFIDHSGNSFPDAGEPKSPDFSGSAPVTWTVRLDRAGNFSYHCQYHPLMMVGNILILGPVTAGGGLLVGLIPGIMLLTLGGVLVFAAVYHVRAVRAAKRMK